MNLTCPGTSSNQRPKRSKAWCISKLKVLYNNKHVGEGVSLHPDKFFDLMPEAKHLEHQNVVPASSEGLLEIRNGA